MKGPRDSDTYTVTISVRGPGGTTKAKFSGIARDTIISPEYGLNAIAALVDLHKYFISDDDPDVKQAPPAPANHPPG